MELELPDHRRVPSFESCCRMSRRSRKLVSERRQQNLCLGNPKFVIILLVRYWLVINFVESKIFPQKYKIHFHRFHTASAATFFSRVETFFRALRTKRKAYSSKWRTRLKTKSLWEAKKKNESQKMAVDTKAHHSDGPVKCFSCTIDGQDTLLQYSDSTSLLTGGQLSLSLAVSLSSLELSLVRRLSSTFSQLIKISDLMHPSLTF